jgi:hypothetical protein
MTLINSSLGKVQSDFVEFRAVDVSIHVFLIPNFLNPNKLVCEVLLPFPLPKTIKKPLRVSEGLAL